MCVRSCTEFIENIFGLGGEDLYILWITAEAKIHWYSFKVERI